MNEVTAIERVTPDDNAGLLHRRATDAAGVCGEIVKRTAQNIQGRKYVKVEGWQAIANAMGCAIGTRDVEKVDGGVRAFAEVRHVASGHIISTAEGFVGEDETTWYGGVDAKGKKQPKRADFAIRAMAQTRAISRAGRSAFAFVVVLIDGNLNTTPAEEMEGVYGEAPDPTVPVSGGPAVAALKAQLPARKMVVPVEKPAVTLDPDKAPSLVDWPDDYEPPAVDAPASDVLIGFGSAKGQPVSSLEMKNLKWYAKTYSENVADPGKARFRDENQRILDAVLAEIERR